MKHLSKATSNSLLNKSSNASSMSSPSSSPSLFSKIGEPSPSGTNGKNWKNILVNVLKVDDEEGKMLDPTTICVTFQDSFDLKKFFEYEELIASKGNYHPNKVMYFANLCRLAFPGNDYVLDQVQTAVEVVLKDELGFVGSKPMTFFPVINHWKISSESLDNLILFLREHLQGKNVPNSKQQFNFVVKEILLPKEKVECFSVFMVNVLPTEISGHVRDLKNAIYCYEAISATVTSKSLSLMVKYILFHMIIFC